MTVRSPAAGLVAAIDIGSNNLWLLIAEWRQGQLRTVYEAAQTVRLGGELTHEGDLRPEAIARALDCLASWMPHLAPIPPAQRYAVATQTLREAHNRDALVAPAQALLQCPVEVISGAREAALTYRGAALGLPGHRQTRIVVDIGGRSTELAQGHGPTLQRGVSLPIGSVSWSQQFFQQGTWTAAAFDAAICAATARLQPAITEFYTAHAEVYGVAGTAHALATALAALGETPNRISLSGLQDLQARLIYAQQVPANIPLPTNLHAVIGGGISVMQAVLQALGVTSLQVTHGALRHGVAEEVLQTLPK